MRWRGGSARRRHSEWLWIEKKEEKREIRTYG
jgi:hypothetical protein